MKAVSFSLWGDIPMYCAGAIRNAELMRNVYPEWTMVVWADSTVPKEIVATLKNLGVEIRNPKCSNGMFWRFAIADDSKVEAFIIRDTDSRIGPREAGSVNQWLESGKAAHVIRDHPSHSPVMSGGLWGARKGAIPNMQKLIDACASSKMESDRRTSYNSDQIFLRESVWPIVKHNCLQHDLCFHDKFQGAQPFPSKFGDDRFVGEVWDANDQPRSFDWQMRINWQEA